MKKSPHNRKVSSEQHQLGVVLEDINSKFDQVLDGHTALDTKIEKVYDEVKEFRKEVDWKFNVVLEEIRDLKGGRIADLEKRVQRLEEQPMPPRR